MKKIDDFFLAVERGQEEDVKSGEFADIDHLIPAQTDHLFRAKLTT